MPKPSIAVNANWVIDEFMSGRGIADICREIGVDRAILYKQLISYGVDITAIREKRLDAFVNQDYFSDIDIEQKAYWLGFLMADGCIYSPTRGQKRLQVQLADKDSEHLRRLAGSLRFKGKIHNNSCKANGYRPQSALFVTSDKLCSGLIKNGCTERKSLTLRFPKHVRRDLWGHLVRGYFDGNGSAEIRRSGVSRPTLRLTIVGASEFIASVNEIFREELGITASVIHNPRGKRCSALASNGNIKSRLIRDWMYKDGTVFLPRKMEVCYSCL